MTDTWYHVHWLRDDGTERCVVSERPREPHNLQRVCSDVIASTASAADKRALTAALLARLLTTTTE